MLVLLPVISFIFLCLLVRDQSRLQGGREVMLAAACLWGVELLAVTEILSAGRMFTREGVGAVWLLLALGAALIYARRARPVWKFSLRHLGIPRVSAVSFGVLICVVILVMTGFVALIAPPNTWDNYSYHLSRVMHWVENATVAFYPTAIPRQLYQNPWAEYAVAHTVLLAGSDRFANLIQWLALLGSLIGVSSLAKRLGASVAGQVLAAAFAATIPMGILQATSAQTDCVTAFWLVCFVYWALRRGPVTGFRLALLGFSLGLAILTKGTAYVFAAPFFLVWSITMFRRQALGALRSLALVGLAVLLINAGHYARNFSLYGSPLGPGQELESGELRYANDVYSAPTFISNVVRNLALQVYITPDVNKRIDTVIKRIHQSLGVDVNDPRTTWTGTRFQMPGRSSLHSDDSAPNMVHLLLILCCVGILFAQRRSRLLMGYALLIALGFLLFCAILRWQPWHSRLHLPLFVLFGPVIGVSLSTVARGRLVPVVMLGLAIVAYPLLVTNSSRSLVGSSNNVLTASRMEAYFFPIPGDIGQAYKDGAAVIADAGCSQVGLILRGELEYPLWVLLQARLPDVRIEHLDVPNVSRRYANPVDFRACALFMVGDARLTQQIDPQAYHVVLAEDPVYVALPN